MNERAFIARLESANTDELLLILSRPSPEEDRVLRVHLGAERYERLRHLALRSATRGVKQKKGNVVVLHGIMGGEMTVFERARSRPVWMSIPRIIFGAVEFLRMGDNGRSLFDVRATGILKRWYSELLVSLSLEWNVQAFWFDWRRDLADSAEQLNDRIDEWFGPNSPVHLIGHSMGGLVARTFIRKYPERWKRAWDTKQNGQAGGRLIMLGTPNHGSFAIPQICTGVEASVRKLVIADLKHSAGELVSIVNTFPGSYQMLPSPAVMPAMSKLYRAETYGAFEVSQALLDRALKSHEELADIVEPDRMVYVAGYNRRTYDDIRDMSALDSIDAYGFSMKGDGTVPHRLGFLYKDGKQILTYFADASHGALPNHDSVISSAPELLETGQCSLPQTPPAGARGGAAKAEAESVERTRLKLEEVRLAQIVQTTRARTRGGEDETAPVSRDEKEAEAMVLRSFLQEPGGPLPAAAVVGTIPPAPARIARGARAAASRSAETEAKARIEIGLVSGGIQNVAATSSDGDSVDVIAVGHYFRVRPQAAERALDRAISAAYRDQTAPKGKKRKRADQEVPDSELLITLLTERGHITANLGEPFILPDPRQPGRFVVLAGMGTPGRFGVPELTVLAQELCWSVGRLGKRHLATVLIGAGTGNLPVPDAVHGWLRGIRRALLSSADDVQRRVCRITFVERDARILRALDLALREAAKNPPDGLTIDYRKPPARVLTEARSEAIEQAKERAEAEFDSGGPQASHNTLVPVRITVGLTRKTYQFAALTQSAAVPQRDIPLDPRLVEAANDELAAAGAEQQNDAGRFLEKLLLPEDIRGEIYSPAPIVLILDSTTARVHWEMIARTDPADRGNTARTNGPDNFLGTSYGLTRQLRTGFAPAPEPPPPPKRVINVLVVADPAEDAPLPGAQAEGEEVANILESFNAIYEKKTGHKIVVTRLFGPAEATRTTVLKKLMLENFDILHFAGHCIYDKEDPANSGWIFSAENDERLTALELQRIDRVPKFIFSNACESGITPDRAEERSAGMAPSFAESFFARGVANFVCTAWPVDDAAARTFAQRLYSELFGLPPATGFAYMHAAMREARRAIAASAGGERTWGAYQHYGNPYFRFFNPQGPTRSAPPGPAPSRRPAGKPRTRRKSPRRRKR
jgi:pimeloyl-ACP methyl ester carboxylesterase